MTALLDHKVKAIGNATINIDEAKGIIEAFVAAVGNKDSVDDIIVPGAFTESLKRRKPRVVWGHNWNEPIGKVLEIFEVPPTDDRLPQKMKDAGVGGLFAKVQFNLASERGREAFATVMFFGEEQEWSIGYKTINKDYDPIRKANILLEVELYEVSPVLHGANNLTGTISVKSADGEVVELVYDAGTTLDDENEAKELEASVESEDEKGLHGTYDFEDEKGEAKMQRLLRNAINGVFGETTKIQFMDGNQIVFIRPDGMMWVVRYALNYPRVSFTPPRRARMRTVVEHIPPMGIEVAAAHGDEDETRKNDASTLDPSLKGTGEGINISTNAAGITISGNTTTSIGNDITFFTTTPSEWADKGWQWEFVESQDETGKEEKVGRVLNKRNMKRLEEALSVIEEIIATGILDEGGEGGEEEELPEGVKSVGGVLFKAYKAAAENSPNDFVVGRPESLNGTSIEIPVADREGSDEVLLALEEQIVALDLAVVAPGDKAFEDGPSKVSIYLSSNEGLRDQIEALAEAIAQVKGDFALSVERKEPMSFSEVFTAGKV